MPGVLKLTLAAAALAAMLYGAWRAYTLYAPDHYDITAPLDLTAKPTFVTAWKLRAADAPACFAALERAGIQFQRLPDEERGEGCVFENVARLEQSAISWGGGVTLTCQMLAGVAQWERHTLQPAAEALFDSRVVRVRHYGTYACRNVNNASTGRRSQHALANAVDVAGFDLENGVTISVLDHWDKDTPEGAFLEQAHAGACGFFGSVLGPDYNALHRNHFHFDKGGFMVCR